MLVMFEARLLFNNRKYISTLYRNYFKWFQVKSIQTNALLDYGLDLTLIRKDLAEKLNLTGSKRCIEISSVF